MSPLAMLNVYANPEGQGMIIMASKVFPAQATADEIARVAEFEAVRLFERLKASLPPETFEALGRQFKKEEAHDQGDD